MQKPHIKILIVDDNPVICTLIRRVLESTPGCIVVGVAQDAYEARDILVRSKPDVMTLDIKMPKIDGKSFLETVTKHQPTPAVVVSEIAPDNPSLSKSLKALGAVAILRKPLLQNLDDIKRFRLELVNNLLRATKKANTELEPIIKLVRESTIIGIAASTGGTTALPKVLETYPSWGVPIVVVQHILPGFDVSLAEKLNANLAISVLTATDGLILKRGHAYIAPSDKHLEIRKNGANKEILLTDAEKVHNVRPAADVMFKSIVREGLGPSSTGIVLTGMGRDGAEGLKEIQACGGTAIAQSERTSTVFGMPRAAIESASSCFVLDLEDIGKTISQAFPQPKR